LHSAFSTTGFVYLTNHGIDENLLDDFFDVSKEFFELDPEIKDKFPMVEQMNIPEMTSAVLLHVSSLSLRVRLPTTTDILRRVMNIWTSSISISTMILFQRWYFTEYILDVLVSSLHARFAALAGGKVALYRPLMALAGSKVALAGGKLAQAGGKVAPVGGKVAPAGRKVLHHPLEKKILCWHFFFLAKLGKKLLWLYKFFAQSISSV
jgi:hypothetical protein